MKRYLPFLIIGAVLAGVAIIVIVLTRTSNSTTSHSTTSQPNSNAYFNYTPPPGALPAHAIGPENAAVTLEEFGDYQCPPRGVMFPEVKKIEADNGPKLRFIFRLHALPEFHNEPITAPRASLPPGPP